MVTEMLRSPFAQRACWIGLAHVVLIAGPIGLGRAQFVPGTGTLVNTDDLELENWTYSHQFPKSSKEEDEQIRYPLGQSSNNMWIESPKRGAPDVVRRVDTPPGGIPGSKGALYLRTRDSGVPNMPGHKQAQDDFILTAKPVSIGHSPSYVVRVYFPEWKEWEQRAGVSFGIRAGMQGPMEKEKPVKSFRRLFNKNAKERVTEMEPYYPGFFIEYVPASAPNNSTKKDYAIILIRSDEMGHEIPGPKITKTGWYTFGMSVTPDARCHFYACAGVRDLTERDFICSSLPYNIRGTMFNTIFFNVCSGDDGLTWSTPWIIDDPKVFYLPNGGRQQQFATQATDKLGW
jgi:hypothetical protein